MASRQFRDVDIDERAAGRRILPAEQGHLSGNERSPRHIPEHPSVQDAGFHDAAEALDGRGIPDQDRRRAVLAPHPGYADQAPDSAPHLHRATTLDGDEVDCAWFVVGADMHGAMAVVDARIAVACNNPHPSDFGTRRVKHRHHYAFGFRCWDPDPITCVLSGG